jgi:carbon monoxide dehydrogenase subunit G
VKLNATYLLPAPPERVFHALVDPDVLQRCIEGAEQLVRTGDDEYDLHLKLGIAVLKGSYIGKVRLADKNPPAAFTLHVEGKGTPGWVRGVARIRLEPRGDSTDATCDAEGHVGGLLAAVGSRLIEPAGRRMMDRFFERVAAEVRAG